MKKMFKGILAIMLVALIINPFIGGKEEIQEVTYNEFLQLLETKKIDTAQLSDEEDIFTFTKKDDETIYRSFNPKTESFRETLLVSDVKVSTIEDDNSTLFAVILTFLPFILFVGVVISIVLFISNVIKKGAQSINAMGASGPAGLKKQKYELISADEIPVSFDDVEGCDETKADLAVTLDQMKNPDKYKECGAKLPKGVLLVGPPGTGKTLMAKAIAKEAGLSFIQASASEFDEMYVGVGAARIRELFEQAKANAPCIIFIDEIDAVGKKRSLTANDKNQTLNQLLTAMDGFESSEGIFVLAATNRVDDLDTALTRPGRFDRKFTMPLPDKKGRLSILKVHAKDKKLSDDISLEQVADMTSGFSGAGLASLLNEAAINAVRYDRKFITFQDIDDSFIKIIMDGNVKNVQEKNTKDKEITAYHEVGHVLVHKLKGDEDVTKVSILSTTSGAGGFTMTQNPDQTFWTKRSMETAIMALYGGRAAEEILLGAQDVTTGASNDIERASGILREYINSYGMTDTVGLLNMNVLMGDTRAFNQEELVKKASEISKRLYTETIDLLKANEGLLHKMAKVLIEKETLNKDEIDKFFKESNSTIDLEK